MRERLPSFLFLPVPFVLFLHHFPLSLEVREGEDRRRREGTEGREAKREREEEAKLPTRSLSCTRIATSESLSPRMLRSFTLAEGGRRIQFICFLHLSSIIHVVILKFFIAHPSQ